MKPFAPKPGRVPCAVPYCRKTCKGDPARHVWLCGDHWKLVDPNTRRLFRRAQRRGRRGVEAYLWEQLVEQAIEAAAGLR